MTLSVAEVRQQIDSARQEQISRLSSSMNEIETQLTGRYREQTERLEKEYQRAVTEQSGKMEQKTAEVEETLQNSLKNALSDVQARQAEALSYYRTQLDSMQKNSKEETEKMFTTLSASLSEKTEQFLASLSVGINTWKEGTSAAAVESIKKDFEAAVSSLRKELDALHTAVHKEKGIISASFVDYQSAIEKKYHDANDSIHSLFSEFNTLKTTFADYTGDAADGKKYVSKIISEIELMRSKLEKQKLHQEDALEKMVTGTEEKIQKHFKMKIEEIEQHLRRTAEGSEEKFNNKISHELISFRNTMAGIKNKTNNEVERCKALINDFKNKAASAQNKLYGDLSASINKKTEVLFNQFQKNIGIEKTELKKMQKIFLELRAEADQIRKSLDVSAISKGVFEKFNNKSAEIAELYEQKRRELSDAAGDAKKSFVSQIREEHDKSAAAIRILNSRLEEHFSCTGSRLQSINNEYDNFSRQFTAMQKDAEKGISKISGAEKQISQTIRDITQCKESGMKKIQSIMEEFSNRITDDKNISAESVKEVKNTAKAAIEQMCGGFSEELAQKIKNLAETHEKLITKDAVRINTAKEKALTGFFKEAEKQLKELKKNMQSVEKEHIKELSGERNTLNASFTELGRDVHDWYARAKERMQEIQSQVDSIDIHEIGSRAFEIVREKTAELQKRIESENSGTIHAIEARSADALKQHREFSGYITQCKKDLDCFRSEIIASLTNQHRINDEKMDALSTKFLSLDKQYADSSDDLSTAQQRAKNLLKTIDEISGDLKVQRSALDGEIHQWTDETISSLKTIVEKENERIKKKVNTYLKEHKEKIDIESREKAAELHKTLQELDAAREENIRSFFAHTEKIKSALKSDIDGYIQRFENDLEKHSHQINEKMQMFEKSMQRHEKSAAAAQKETAQLFDQFKGQLDEQEKRVIDKHSRVLSELSAYHESLTREAGQMYAKTSTGLEEINVHLARFADMRQEEKEKAAGMLNVFKTEAEKVFSGFTAHADTMYRDFCKEIESQVRQAHSKLQTASSENGKIIFAEMDERIARYESGYMNNLQVLEKKTACQYSEYMKKFNVLCENAGAMIEKRIEKTVEKSEKKSELFLQEIRKETEKIESGITGLEKEKTRIQSDVNKIAEQAEAVQKKISGLEKISEEISSGFEKVKLALPDIRNFFKSLKEKAGNAYDEFEIYRDELKKNLTHRAEQEADIFKGLLEKIYSEQKLLTKQFTEKVMVFENEVSRLRAELTEKNRIAAEQTGDAFKKSIEDANAHHQNLILSMQDRLSSALIVIKKIQQESEEKSKLLDKMPGEVENQAAKALELINAYVADVRAESARIVQDIPGGLELMYKKSITQSITRFDHVIDSFILQFKTRLENETHTVAGEVLQKIKILESGAKKEIADQISSCTRYSKNATADFLKEINKMKKNANTPFALIRSRFSRPGNDTAAKDHAQSVLIKDIEKKMLREYAVWSRNLIIAGKTINKKNTEAGKILEKAVKDALQKNTELHTHISDITEIKKLKQSFENEIRKAGKYFQLQKKKYADDFKNAFKNIKDEAVQKSEKIISLNITEVNTRLEELFKAAELRIAQMGNDGLAILARGEKSVHQSVKEAQEYFSVREKILESRIEALAAKHASFAAGIDTLFIESEKNLEKSINAKTSLIADNLRKEQQDQIAGLALRTKELLEQYKAQAEKYEEAAHKVNGRIDNLFQNNFADIDARFRTFLNTKQSEFKNLFEKRKNEIEEMCRGASSLISDKTGEINRSAAAFTSGAIREVDLTKSEIIKKLNTLETDAAVKINGLQNEVTAAHADFKNLYENYQNKIIVLESRFDDGFLRHEQEIKKQADTFFRFQKLTEEKNKEFAVNLLKDLRKKSASYDSYMKKIKRKIQNKISTASETLNSSMQDIVRKGTAQCRQIIDLNEQTRKEIAEQQSREVNGTAEELHKFRSQVTAEIKKELVEQISLFAESAKEMRAELDAVHIQKDDRLSKLKNDFSKALVEYDRDIQKLKGKFEKYEERLHNDHAMRFERLTENFNEKISQRELLLEEKTESVSALEQQFIMRIEELKKRCADILAEHEKAFVRIQNDSRELAGKIAVQADTAIVTLTGEMKNKSETMFLEIQKDINNEISRAQNELAQVSSGIAGLNEKLSAVMSEEKEKTIQQYNTLSESLDKKYDAAQKLHGDEVNVIHARIEEINNKIRQFSDASNIFSKIEEFQNKMRVNFSEIEKKAAEAEAQTKNIRLFEEKTAEFTRTKNEVNSAMLALTAKESGIQKTGELVNRLLSLYEELQNQTIAVENGKKAAAEANESIRIYNKCMQDVLTQREDFEVFQKSVQETGKVVEQLQKDNSMLQQLHVSLKTDIIHSVDTQKELDLRIENLENAALTIQNQNKKISEFTEKFDQIDAALLDIGKREKNIQRLKQDLHEMHEELNGLKNTLNDQMHTILERIPQFSSQPSKAGIESVQSSVKKSSGTPDRNDLSSEDISELIKSLSKIGWSPEAIAKKLKMEIYEIEMHLS